MISTIINAATANTTSPPIDMGTGVSDHIGIETILAGGTPSFNLQLQGSEDGNTYFNIGPAITGAGLTAVATSSTPVPPVRFLQALITSYSGTGSITAIVDAIPLA